MARRPKLAACSHSTPFVLGHCRLSQEGFSLKQNTLNKATKKKIPPLREACWVKIQRFFFKKIILCFLQKAKSRSWVSTNPRGSRDEQGSTIHLDLDWFFSRLVKPILREPSWHTIEKRPLHKIVKVTQVFYTIHLPPFPLSSHTHSFCLSLPSLPTPRQ